MFPKVPCEPAGAPTRCRWLAAGCELARIQILAPGSSSLKPPRWSSAPSRAALIATHYRTASAELTARPKEKAPAIVALAGAKSQMQALHSERRYFRRIALRELIDVSVIDNSNVNGVAKMLQPPRNRRLPTDVTSADRASSFTWSDGPCTEAPTLPRSGPVFVPSKR